MIYRNTLIPSALLLVGCALGPNYQRPELGMPQSWKNGSAPAAVPVSSSVAQPLANLRWWEQLQDQALDSLIVDALQSNQDLVAATARLEQYYARVGISRAEFFPEIDLNGSYQRGEASPARFGLETQNSSGPVNNFAASLGLAWELDFWGRIRRSNEATRAELLGQEHGRRAAILALVSAVAQGYLNLRLLDEQLAIAVSTRDNRIGSLDFARARYDSGVTSELEVLQSATELAAAEATIPQLETLLLKQEHALCLLLGRNPGPIKRDKPLAQLHPATTVPAGVPSDVLTNRPDVAQAEASLRAANALIGVAYANYLPRISLTGLFGYESLELDDLFKRGSRAWSYGPQMTLPIFNTGRLGYQLDEARARAREADAVFRQTVLNALREVEDALVSFRNSAAQLDARTRLLDASSKYLALARRRYEEGQSTNLEVLDAQRRLFQAQLEQAASQADRVQAWVGLYRALGGGWIEQAEQGSHIS